MALSPRTSSDRDVPKDGRRMSRMELLWTFPFCSWIKPKHWARILFLPSDSREVYIYSGLLPDENNDILEGFWSHVCQYQPVLSQQRQDSDTVCGKYGALLDPCNDETHNLVSTTKQFALWKTVSDILYITVHTVIMTVKILLLFAINSGSIVSCKHARGSEKLYCFLLLSNLLLFLTLMSNFTQDCFWIS